jgi:3-methylcrotonyl-CoA carboxylase alpha subunit
VYAESPEDGFLPQAGRIEHIRWPDNARVDSGVEEGTEVSTHYDPLLAKVVVHAADRTAALDALRLALDETQVLGVRTNLTFLAAVSREPTVTDAAITTDWLDDAGDRWAFVTDPPDVAMAIAAAAETDRVYATSDGSDPWSALGGWRAGGVARARVIVRAPDEERVMVVDGLGPFVVDERWRIARGKGCHRWFVDGKEAAAARGDGRWFVWTAGVAYDVPLGAAPRRLDDAGPSRLESPLPGRVIAVRTAPGLQVARGEELVVVEAMKMEHPITASSEAVVRAVLCAPGDQVERGQTLVDLEPVSP